MGSKPAIILASKSTARQTMLQNAGICFEAMPTDLDEEKIMKSLPADAKIIATALAKEKALKASKKNPYKIIIGSDQVLSMDEKIYSKAKTVEEAVERLMEFQGKSHSLTSAVCLAQDGEIIWEYTETATLKMKPLNSQDIDKYRKIAGDALTACVGCYAIEGAGIRLFESIKGDHFTILGMPLLPLIHALEQQGAQL